MNYYSCTTCLPEPVSNVTINSYNMYPVGFQYDYMAGLEFPYGALQTNGAWVSKTTYPDLYAVLVGAVAETDTLFQLPTRTPADSGYVGLIQALPYYTQIGVNRWAVVLTPVITESPAGTFSGYVTLQVQDGNGNAPTNNFALRVWFVDSALDRTVPSVIPPTTPGVSERNVVTDATGLFTLNVAETGALRNWYLCASLDGEVFISSVIGIGVSP